MKKELTIETELWILSRYVQHVEKRINFLEPPMKRIPMMTNEVGLQLKAYKSFADIF